MRALLEAAQDKVKKEFEELTFEVGKESIRDHVARAKALVMKLEQHSVSTTKYSNNRLIVESLMAFPLFSMLKKKCF